jgi:hypothetical protein
MSSSLRALLVTLVTLAALSPRATRGQHISVCGDKEKRYWLRFRIEPLMLSTDSATTANRRLYRLPLVHPDSIRYIDDERICARAAKAYYRGNLGPQPLRGVSVARVGDVWVVLGEIHAGEWTSMMIFDRNFDLVASVGT